MTLTSFIWTLSKLRQSLETKHNSLISQLHCLGRHIRRNLGKLGSHLAFIKAGREFVLTADGFYLHYWRFYVLTFRKYWCHLNRLRNGHSRIKSINFNSLKLLRMTQSFLVWNNFSEESPSCYILKNVHNTRSALKNKTSHTTKTPELLNKRRVHLKAKEYAFSPHT